MNDLPKRKKLRMKQYNYSDCGLYFVTLCVKDGNELLWNNVKMDCNCLEKVPELSETGRAIEEEIRRLSQIYENVTVDKYCIMPNHIHMIILI